MSKSSKPPLATGATAERQLGTFIAKFSPTDQVRIRAARRALRRQFAGAWELVYDNYNFFVIGYAPTDRPSEAVISLARGRGQIVIRSVSKKQRPRRKRGNNSR